MLIVQSLCLILFTSKFRSFFRKFLHRCRRCCFPTKKQPGWKSFAEKDHLVFCMLLWYFKTEHMPRNLRQAISRKQRSHRKYSEVKQMLQLLISY